MGNPIIQTTQTGGAGVGTPGVLDWASNGNWCVGHVHSKTSEKDDMYVCDIRIAGVARSAEWFQEVYDKGKQ